MKCIYTVHVLMLYMVGYFSSICAVLISLEQPSYTVREDLTDGKGFALLICAFLQEQITQNATVVLQAFTSEDDTATGEVHVLLCFLAALYHALKYIIIIFCLACRMDLGDLLQCFHHTLVIFFRHTVESG